MLRSDISDFLRDLPQDVGWIYVTLYIGIGWSQAKHDVCFLDEADVPIVRSSIHQDGNYNDNAWPNLVLMHAHHHDQAHGAGCQ